MTSPEPRTLEELKAERDAAFLAAYAACDAACDAAKADYNAALEAYRKALKAQENSDA